VAKRSRAWYFPRGQFTVIYYYFYCFVLLIWVGSCLFFVFFMRDVDFIGEGRLEDPPFTTRKERARGKAHQKQVIFWRGLGGA
jgi:hypothetical protein